MLPKPAPKACINAISSGKSSRSFCSVLTPAAQASCRETPPENCFRTNCRNEKSENSSRAASDSRSAPVGQSVNAISLCIDVSSRTNRLSSRGRARTRCEKYAPVHAQAVKISRRLKAFNIRLTCLQNLHGLSDLCAGPQKYDGGKTAGGKQGA